MQPAAIPAVRYATSVDGLNIAYLVAGEGRTVVFLPFHHNHLEHRWTAGGYPGWLRPLAETNRLIAYDSRGQGLSSRNLDRDPSPQDYLYDLEAVLQATEVRSSVLVAYGGFTHVALRYAVDHPEAVDGVVLMCSCESFSSWPVAGIAVLAKENWDLLLELETAKVPEMIRPAILSFMRQSSTNADYAGLVRAFSRSNVTELLPKLSVPALILHSLDQHWLSPEEGTRFAARVPGARLVFLNGDAEPNDIAGVRAIMAFLADLPERRSQGELSAAGAIPDGPSKHEIEITLSRRQLEVLRLIAQGKTTREIAELLVLSDRTVERHIADVYSKIGARNRAEATSFALHSLKDLSGA